MAGREDPLLLLFDIDGTLLVGAAGPHAESLRAALAEVHGINAAKLPGPQSPAGRTDGEIARRMLLTAGISAERIDERASEVAEVCCREFAERCPADLSHTVVPGVADLLAWLGGVETAKLSLVTGNYETVARIKLARAGIGARFAAGQGGFGSDSEDRAALPALARRRAGAAGRPHDRQATVVIGDTPRDIACARADGVRCFAVTTGPYGAEQLVGADAVASSAAALRERLASELGAVRA